MTDYRPTNGTDIVSLGDIYGGLVRPTSDVDNVAQLSMHIDRSAKKLILDTIERLPAVLSQTRRDLGISYGDLKITVTEVGGISLHGADDELLNGADVRFEDGWVEFEWIGQVYEPSARAGMSFEDVRERFSVAGRTARRERHEAEQPQARMV